MVVPPEPGSSTDRKVVIDAGAAIKLQRLDRFGGELYTTGGVIREIRDENARALLKTLPTEIRVREAPAQDVAFVKQFAKATGDLGFLSANDIELIALTVNLQREAGLPVRERPAALTMEAGSQAFDWAPARAGAAASASAPTGSGAATAPADAAAAASADAEAAVSTDADATAVPADAEAVATLAEANAAAASAEAAAASTAAAASEVGGTAAPRSDGADRAAASASIEGQEAADEAAVHAGAESAELSQPAQEVEQEPEQQQEQDQEDAESEDGSSAGEWVTQDNMCRFGLGVDAAAAATAPVACATADYSVQNVLLQMGIAPLTFDGYAVRNVKLWGLICRACFFFSRDTQKVFCAKCGNDTVVRVPIVVDQDGKASVLNNGRKLRTKGTVYSVPKPQGGRGWRPVFAEDEMLMGSRARELRHQQRVHEKDRQSRDPFNEDNGARAWWQRSGTSTGRMLGQDAPRVQAGYGRRNPNSNNFRFKGGKKR